MLVFIKWERKNDTSRGRPKRRKNREDGDITDASARVTVLK